MARYGKLNTIPADPGLRCSGGQGFLLQSPREDLPVSCLAKPRALPTGTFDCYESSTLIRLVTLFYKPYYAALKLVKSFFCEYGGSQTPHDRASCTPERLDVKDRKKAFPRGGIRCRTVASGKGRIPARASACQRRNLAPRYSHSCEVILPGPLSRLPRRSP